MDCGCLPRQQTVFLDAQLSGSQSVMGFQVACWAAAFQQRIQQTQPQAVPSLAAREPLCRSQVVRDKT
jgi:hypothetical protein